MPTRFKLKFDDLTRKVSFDNQPNWSELSDKISVLYSIPQHQVAVTYIDAENEEITLSTEDELQDYYFSSYRPGEIIKFSVRDLTSRSRRTENPIDTGIRNTFGQFVDPEIPGIDEWQSVNDIPPLSEIIGHGSPASEVRSAFVETVVSDESTVGKAAADRTFGAEPAAARPQSKISEVRIPSMEKGKERAHFVRSMSSTQSLLAEHIGDKYPVHVYDVSSRSRSPLVHGFSFDHDAGAAIAAESTPRVPTSSLEESAPNKKPEHAQEVDDPPIPPLESTDPQPTQQTAEATEATQSAEASASLARDAASFLSTVSKIVSSHPELSESLRTIVRNTTNGTYWASHREALSHAAREFQRNTENFAGDGRRVVEEEAGRRLADALAGVLRIFSQAQASIQGDSTQDPSATINSDNQQFEDRHTQPPRDANASVPDPPQSQTPPMPGSFSTADFATGFGGPFPFVHGRGWHGWRARASMPPNFATGGFPRWTMPPMHPSVGPFPPFGSGVHNVTNAATSSHVGAPPFFQNAFQSAPGQDPTLNDPDQISPETSTSIEGQGQQASPQELKAKVEEAKKTYREEKARYRRERDERKKERDQENTPKKPDTINTMRNIVSEAPSDHIAANARHGFPRFDIVNVTESPRRHNTHPGHSYRRHERPAEDLFTRAANRIGKRLADMGFTEKAYPDLPEKIKNYLPSDGGISKDSEDDIVTTLLESMLAAPKSPVASGSGARDIPGGWH